ncbi:phage major capsid protein [Glutamicibacter sp. BSL13]
MHPSDALAISKLKDSTNSNKSLLENPRVILGRPVIVSAKATAGVLWVIDKAAVITVLREDTELAVSDAPFFTSDRIALRATTRLGLGFAIPNRLVKIYDVTPGV